MLTCDLLRDVEHKLCVLASPELVLAAGCQRQQSRVAAGGARRRRRLPHPRHLLRVDGLRAAAGRLTGHRRAAAHRAGTCAPPGSVRLSARLRRSLVSSMTLHVSCYMMYRRKVAINLGSTS